MPSENQLIFLKMGEGGHVKSICDSARDHGSAAEKECNAFTLYMYILKILVIKYGANFRVHLEDEVLLSQKKISGWFCL